MKLTEKMSYLQGLLDGLEIDNSTKEGKALLQMSDVMSDLVAYVEDLQSQVDELTELCDILDQDLGQVEEDITMRTAILRNAANVLRTMMRIMISMRTKSFMRLLVPPAAILSLLMRA